MHRLLNSALVLRGAAWSAFVAGLLILRSAWVRMTAPIVLLYGMLPKPVRIRIALLVLLPLFGLAQAFAMVRYTWCIAADTDRAWQIAVAEDRQANVAANGDPRETISSRADRARAEGRRWGCVLCRLLDSIQSNHCRNSAGQ